MYILIIILLIGFAFIALWLAKVIAKQTWKEFFEQQRIELIQSRCRHEKWNCDKQIRTIECKQCKKRAWIDDYVNLYK